MPQHHRAHRAVATAACLVVAAAGLSACSSDDPKGTQTPSTWGVAQGQNATTQPETTPADGDYRVVAAEPLTLSLAEDGKSAMVSPDSWPDLREMISIDQWKGILPGQSLDRPSVCAYGSLPSGGTPKFTQCTWEFGDGSPKPRIRLQIKAIGADSEVLKKFDGTRSEYRNENSNGDRFYENGAYGARRVLLRGNGLGSFVVSDGQVAMWMEAQFPEQSIFSGANDEQSSERVRTGVFPTLVKTMVTYLPRKH